MNLAVNARDAMPHGGRLILQTADVDLKESLLTEKNGIKGGRYVMLAVSDSGLGMTEEVISHLFEPFFTTKDPGKGTGLGLSTVYGIVRQSDGCILVDSEPGVGSTFTIYLPLVESRVEAEQKESAASLSLAGTETILVVEDEEAVRDLACRVLRMRGYQVLAAPEAASALQICDSYEGSISLLVSDVVMPGMGGPELARLILTLRPGIKVLFVSGYSEEAIRSEGILEPSTLLVQKPFTPENLCRKVRQLLDSPHR
jgi:two-component system, cell cycle sensor histidine kinase and response regulator CckA